MGFGTTDNTILLPTAPMRDVICTGVLPVFVRLYVSCTATELHELAGITDSKSEQAVVVPFTAHFVVVTCKQQNCIACE